METLGSFIALLLISLCYLFTIEISVVVRWNGVVLLFLHFAASFFLWFVSCGLLTVLWALAIGLLCKYSLLWNVLFQIPYVSAWIMIFSVFSLSQPLFFMQALEHLIWRLALTHSVRNFELSGAIIASCSFHRVPFRVSYYPEIFHYVLFILLFTCMGCLFCFSSVFKLTCLFMLEIILLFLTSTIFCPWMSYLVCISFAKTKEQ